VAMCCVAHENQNCARVLDPLIHCHCVIAPETHAIQHITPMNNTPWPVSWPPASPAPSFIAPPWLLARLTMSCIRSAVRLFDKKINILQYSRLLSPRPNSMEHTHQTATRHSSSAHVTSSTPGSVLSPPAVSCRCLILSQHKIIMRGYTCAWYYGMSCDIYLPWDIMWRTLCYILIIPRVSKLYIWSCIFHHMSWRCQEMYRMQKYHKVGDAWCVFCECPTCRLSQDIFFLCLLLL